MITRRTAWAVFGLIAIALGGGCQRHDELTPAQLRHPLVVPEAQTLKPTEGMWLYGNLPSERLRQEFNFEPTKPWETNLRLASVRIGASGEFVSPDGLILTNHHVAAGPLQTISGPGKDYVSNGFYAKTRDEEIKLPGLEVSVLVSMKDVTRQVNAATHSDMTPEQVVKARNAAIAKIERESEKETGLQSSVVTLFGGARYDLYRYKRYTDVRAVFAPEFAAAFFGGDPDNFEYPRYDLDISFLRAYENGKPARTEHYLPFAHQGVRDGDVVFVSGHPGTTDRLLPVASLLAMRDLTLPAVIQWLESQEKAIRAYEQQGPEQRRQAQRDIFGIENSLKALRPRQAALQGNLIDRKRREEAALRNDLEMRVSLAHYSKAWDRIGAIERRNRHIYYPFTFLEGGRAFATPLFGYARTLVRLPAEDAKPDSQRLPEFNEAKRQPLVHRLVAERPIYNDLEIAKLTASLTMFRDKLGANSPLVKSVLGDKSPEDRARELVSGTKLADPAFRKQLLEGGAKAIAESDDPMIQLARHIDPESRRIRREYETRVEEPLTHEQTQINRARFALFGNSIYPDATGTLRLAFGIVKGYEQDGSFIPPWTMLGGAFQYEKAHNSQYPYQLPESWHKAQDRIDPNTPLNFVSTADITGGNSGSPVVNREGELVGVIFDSNRQGVANNFEYTDIQARAVSVDVRAIVETLRKVYGADNLLNELLGEQVIMAQQ
ncbi:MAG TPA: S46 family peptidase [Tepidisphaeraceae bacterium]|nr:S46 family peptidase [Tepidisphaeraceae bacterium]